MAGVVAMFFAGSLSRSEIDRSVSTISEADGSTAHQRATVAAPHADDHHVTLDLSAVTPDVVLPLLAALVTAVAAARLTTGIGARPATATGRAPPRR